MTAQKSFRKSSPCPICGSYAGAYTDKCKGFITATGVVYCQRVEAAESFVFYGGLLLFKHALSEVDQEQGQEQVLERGSDSSFAITSASPSPRTDYSNTSLSQRTLVTEEKTYPAGAYSPAETKTWYIVLNEDGTEVTRSLNRQTAERFL
jgi:hypothetical protein